MLLAALALAAVPASRPVEEAERAFASAAQTDGQWTAFRAFAAPGALLLTDRPVDAATLLAPLRDPRAALMWWPAETITACDGSLAISTGPWRSAKDHGRYLTVWQRQPDGVWKWIYDGGGADTPGGSVSGDRIRAVRPMRCGRARGGPEPRGIAGGASADGSLRWRLDKAATGYRFRASLDEGRGPRTLIDRIVGT